MAVLCAGFAWGFMGLFTRHLNTLGIDAAGSVMLRCIIGALCFLALILATEPSRLRIRLRDLWVFFGVGVVSLLFFTFCYFRAIELMSLSAAAILLYTAPMFVVILSAVLFRERLTRSKLVAMALAFAGCALVSGLAGGVRVTATGLLLGLSGGIGYALFTVFSRYAINRGYTSATINFYACVLAALGTLVIWQPVGAVKVMFSSIEAFGWALGLGVVTSFIPYYLYTRALGGLENGRAAVIASIEPVVASLVGVLVFAERLTLPMTTGVALVVVAIIVLNAEAFHPRRPRFVRILHA